MPLHLVLVVAPTAAPAALATHACCMSVSHQIGCTALSIWLHPRLQLQG